jgi:hypothetical protein
VDVLVGDLTRALALLQEVLRPDEIFNHVEFL